MVQTRKCGASKENSGLPILLAILLAMLLAGRVAAQDEAGPFPNEDINLGRGFSVDTSVLSLGQLDQVSLLNGNLTVTLPVGPSYPVGSGLSYGVSLIYNSSIWDNRRTDCPYDDGRCQAGQVGEAWPQLDSNAGVGWKLSLGGELYPPRPNRVDLAVNKLDQWVFLGPDGATHAFYDRLHGEVDDGAASLLYTNDGTYMRMKVGPFPPPPGQRQARIIQIGDGTEYRFELFDPETGRDWRLTRISNQYSGNWVETEYPFDLSGLPDWVVTIRDSRGREHRFHFDREPAGDNLIEPPDLNRDRGRLRWAELATFDSPLPPTVPSTPSLGSPNAWVFDYEMFTLMRGDDHPDTPDSMTAPMLVAVRPPVGAGFSFRYWGQDGTVNTEATSGRLREMTLPTGGKVSWVYGPILFPENSRCRALGGDPVVPAHFVPGWVSNVTGVTKRTETDGTLEASVSEAVWTYTRQSTTTLAPCDPDNPGQLQKFPLVTEGRVTVADPLGNNTVHFFSLFNQEDLGTTGSKGLDYPMTEGWTRREYGLSLTRSTAFDPSLANAGQLVNPLPGEEVFLSQLTYAGAVTPANLAESVWVAYEQDPFESLAGPDEDAQPPTADRNRRLIKRVRRFEKASGDEGTMVIEDFSDFDGFGHYRTAVTRGVGYPGTQQRTSTTRYNNGDSYVPSGDVATWDPTTGPWVTTMTLPGFTDPWLVNLFDLSREQDATGATVTHLCRDPATGFVLKERRLKNANGLSSGDILLVRSPDADGNVAKELVYGGDLQGLGTAGHCGSATGSAVRRTDHTYRAGALKSSAIVDDGDGTVLFLSANNTIDVSTGLPAESSDASGVLTTFDYDPLGRLVSQQTAGDAPMVVTYQDAAPPAKIVIESKTSLSPAATVLTKGTVTVDGFGRVTLEQTERPGMTGPNAATRKAVFDALGRVASATVYTAGTPPAATKKTLFSRDYRGRLLGVTRPDGTTRSFVYLGNRKVSLTMNVDGKASTTDALRDVFGRVVEVVEPSGPSGERISASYEYDHADNLTLVRTEGRDHGGASVTQLREFVYDDLGFLRCESHPELSAAGTPCANSSVNAGTVRYEDYDAGGNPGRVLTVGLRVIETDYDAAGNPVRIWEVPTSGPRRLLQELYYGRRDAGADKSRGKMVLAKRHNPVGNGFTTVTQTLRYLDPAGRVSEASLRSTSGRRFRTTYTYDELGNVDRIDYPLCLSPDCAGSPPTGVDFDYVRGALTRVREVTAAGAFVDHASNISYLPSGLMRQVDHPITNGLLQEISEADPDGIPRSGRIHFRSSVTGSDLLNLGTPTWDAAGNVLSLGANTYDYDLVGRLTRGTAVGGTLAQTASYDAFGNVLLQTPAEGTVGQPVDPYTNRLIGPGYDAFGNIVGGSGLDNFFGLTIHYDAFNRPIASTTTGVNRSMLYDPNGNRVATLDHLDGTELWTLRGAGGKVLREVEVSKAPLAPSAAWSKDYFYRNGLLAASRSSTEGARHVFLDHLGSTRLVTDRNGTEVARYEYFPFGQLAKKTGAEQGKTRLLFTGHERDANAGSDNDDLDYMLARNYSAAAGRFLSLDEVLGTQGNPQSWNRYAYARNSPLALVDPDGRHPHPQGPAASPVLESVDALATSTVGFSGVGLLLAGGVPAGALGAPLAATPPGVIILAGAAVGAGTYKATRKLDDSLAAATGDPLALEKGVAGGMFGKDAGFLIDQYEGYLESGTVQAPDGDILQKEINRAEKVARMMGRGAEKAAAKGKYEMAADWAATAKRYAARARGLRELRDQLGLRENGNLNLKTSADAGECLVCRSPE